MLARILSEIALTDTRTAVLTPRYAAAWGELARLTRFLAQQHGDLGRRRVGLSFHRLETGCAAFAAMEQLECDLFLMDASLSLEAQLHLAGKFKLGALFCEDQPDDSMELQRHNLVNEAKWSGQATVTILTSGTSGEPKAATHTWQSLGRPVRESAKYPMPRWLLSYRPTLYAGLQVIHQCLANQGTLVVPGADADPRSIAELLVSSGVQFVSATPSYWRRLLMFADADLQGRTQIVQVTLGGEAVDQSLLDRLKRCFPQARLVHIYATTELGRCFSVTDGLAGFPIAYLQKPLPDGVALRIEEGELQVKPANAMQRYDPLSSCPWNSRQDWFATGDLVSIQGDRVVFTGRKSDMINVAGNKVHPIEVERVLRQVPGVADARVYARRSSVAGQLVACELVAKKGQDPAVLKEKVAASCLANLTSYQRPRFVEFVDQITLSSAGKTTRRTL